MSTRDYKHVDECLLAGVYVAAAKERKDATMDRLKDRVAVITGAGRGIGRGYALLFAKEGAKVVVNDPGVNLQGTGHDSGPADQVVEEIRRAGGVAVPNYESVATSEGGERIIGSAIDNFGRIDILVNNAGIARDHMVFNMTEEEWDAVIAVHLKGTFNCTKPASILMREQRFGRILNISSSAGLSGWIGLANYGAAKSGIAGLTRVVAKDLGRYGITCNAIAPGGYTRMTQTLADQSQAARLPRPEMVAPMAVYLCSDAAWNINGQVFHVSGKSVSLSNPPVPFRTISKPGVWTLDELVEAAPALMDGITNPAPPAADIDVPGRPAQATA